jgi:hypothetical protein
VLIGVVARAHQRPSGDVLETEPVGRPLELGEFVGVPVADDRQVPLGRTQVLAHGQYLDVALAQLTERVDHLLEGLAEPDHKSGFGGDCVTGVRLGVAQHPL